MRSATSCCNNLSAIGKAMLAYANDYNGALPRAGGRNAVWGPTYHWNATDREGAFGLADDGSGGTATISASLYLLVKHTYLPPKTFVCKADAGTTELGPSDVPGLSKDFKLTDAWDFGPQGYRHCSYSYHMPYGSYALTTACDPGMAVAADRNPWIESPASAAGDVYQFKPDIAPLNGSPEQARKGNAIAHWGQGQNVLFLDGHAALKKRAYCGLDDDNIYLASASPDKGSPLGIASSPLVTMPCNKRDSVLVHDPPDFSSMPVTAMTMTIRRAEEIDSKSLKETAVVAALDCPLPEHKNVIWCSTFQMAWDKLKQEVIGEPIRLVGAEELAGWLNRAQYPTGDIEAKSYYAAAGFVKNGIIEEIQKQMKQRFPSEPVPTFDAGTGPCPTLFWRMRI